MKAGMVSLAGLLWMWAQPEAVGGDAGTINFANAAMGVNAPAVMKSTGMPLSGSYWEAELWVVEAGAEPVKAGSVPFESGDLAGYFFGGRADIPGINAGDTAIVQVRIVHTEAGEAWRSGPMTLKLGGGKAPPPNFAMLAGMEVSPPLVITVEDGEGGTGMISWPQDAGPVVLQTTTALPAAEWEEVELPMSANGDLISVTVQISEEARFFRLYADWSAP